MFRTVYLHNQSCVLLEEPLLPVLNKGHKKIIQYKYTYLRYLHICQQVYIAQFEETNGVLSTEQ